jgi:hypothetical protein
MDYKYLWVGLSQRMIPTVVLDFVSLEASS